jgi:CheY-like chemotaxis protein
MKKLTVAIFEDDEVNRFIYRNILKSRKDEVDVHVFADPEKGLEVAQTIPFDIVLIESHFWGRNFFGIYILNELKKLAPKGFTAIAITSLLQEGDVERLTRAGFTMCLEKPLSFEIVERAFDAI